MPGNLTRRLAALEAAATRHAFVTGWTISSAGELIGFVPSFGRPDPQLQAWLAHPYPGFVFLIARDIADISTEDRAALIPAGQASAEARRLVEPYTTPGAALHLT